VPFIPIICLTYLPPVADPLGLSRRGRRLAVLLMILGLLAAVRLRAAASLTETFAGPALGAGWDLSLAGSFGYADGVATNVAGSGHYIRTVATDFRDVDFTLELTYTNQDGYGGAGIVFFGLGAGVPDGDFYTEPLQALYLRHAPGDFGDGFLQPSLNSGPGSVDEMAALGLPGSGTHRALVTKTDALLVFSVDAFSSGGTFVADYTTSFDLGEGRFGFLDATNSRLFFGSQGGGVAFDSALISVSGPSIPEPGTWAAWLGLAALGLVAGWRRS
jgi:MYXO-CTERM domain-containing protein